MSADTATINQVFDEVWHAHFIQRYEEMRRQRSYAYEQSFQGRQWIAWGKEIDPDMQLDEGL